MAKCALETHWKVSLSFAKHASVSAYEHNPTLSRFTNCGSSSLFISCVACHCIAQVTRCMDPFIMKELYGGLKRQSKR